MAKNIFELFGEIGVKNGKAIAAIDETVNSAQRASISLGKKFSTVGKSFEKIGGKMQKVGKAATIGITTGLVGIGTSMAKTAFKFLQLKEDAKVGFEALLGGADKAKKMMDDLYKYALKTPFPYDSYLTTGKTLVAMGVEAKNVVPYLDAVTNAAIATGKGKEGLENLSGALGKMVAKGKISLETIQQFTEAGIPVVKILANELHTTDDAIYKMMSQGKLLTKDTLPKLIKGMQEGTNGAEGMTAAYGALAEEVKGTLRGSLDSLHSAWRNISIKMLDAEHAYPAITKMIRNITALILQIPPIFEKWSVLITPTIDKINKKLEAFNKKLQDILSSKDAEAKLDAIRKKIVFFLTLGPKMYALGTAIKVAGKALSWYGDQVTNNTKIYKLLSGNIKSLKERYLDFAKTINTIRNNLSSAFADIKAGFLELGKAIKVTLEPITNGINKLKALLMPFFEKLKQKIIELLDVLKGYIEQFISYIHDKLSKVISAIVNAFNTVKDKIIGAFEAIKSAVIRAKDVIVRHAIAIKDKILDMIPEGFKNVVARFRAGVTKMIDKLAEFGVVALGKAQDRFHRFSEHTKKAFGLFGSGISKATQGIGKFVKSGALIGGVAVAGVLMLAKSGINIEAETNKILTMFKNFLLQLPQQITTMVPQIINALMSLTSNIPILVNGLVSAIVAIVNALPTLLPVLLTAIQSLITALIPAVISLLPLVLQVGIQLFMGLVQAVSKILPSLMAKLPQIITTLVNFVQENLPAVLTLAVQLFTQIIEGLAKFMPVFAEKLPGIINIILNIITQNLPTILTSAVNMFLQIVVALIKMIPVLAAKLPEIISTIKRVLKTNWPTIKKAGKDIFMQLVKAIPEIVSAMFRSAGNIVTGLINGVKSKFGELGSIGREMGSKLVKAFKRRVDEHSPSRVFAKSGVNIVKGLVNGISDNLSQVGKASIAMADRVIEPMKTVAGDVKDELGDIFDGDSKTLKLQKQVTSQSLVSSKLETPQLQQLREDAKSQTIIIGLLEMLLTAVREGKTITFDPNSLANHLQKPLDKAFGVQNKLKERNL